MGERERDDGPFFFTGFPPCIIGDDFYWSDRGREMLMPTMGGGKLAHHACLACGGRSEVGGNCGLLGPVGWMYFRVAGVRVVR